MAKGKKKRPELVLAADQGDLDTINRLLDKRKRGKTEEKDGCGDTALNIAAFKGRVDVVNELVLGRKADVETTDERGWTPMISAAYNGHVEIIQVLVGKRAKLEHKTHTGKTALNAAASKGHLEAVEELLSSGADTELADNKGWTPLNNAASEGHVDVVRCLLDNGAKKDAMNHAGFTPLNSASCMGQVEVMELLMDRGADINLVNKQGFSALATAALAGQEEVVEALLKRTAKVQDDGRKTATDKDKEKEVSKKPAVDINMKTTQGFTPLILAAQEGHKNVVSLLINKGADINLTTNEGATAVHMASQQGHLSVVMMLSEKRADVNTKTTSKNTPLISTCKEGHLGIAQFLLGKGALVDEQNEDGESALHWAADGGHTDLVKFLVQYKANVKLKDKDGKTAQIRAKKNGKKHEAVIYLKDYESGKIQKQRKRTATKNGPAQIFISYSWEKKIQIEKLTESLSFLGYSCWLDTDFMGTNDDLYDEVYKGMKGCTVVITSVTVDYTKTTNSRREVTLADQMKKPLIPLQMESMKWPPEGPMGKSFKGTEPIPIYEDDAVQIEWSGPLFDQLVERIKEHIPKPANVPGQRNSSSSSVCVIQ